MSIKHFSSHVEFVFTPSHYPNPDPISRYIVNSILKYYLYNINDITILNPDIGNTTLMV
jgi:hypothetical protein